MANYIITGASSGIGEQCARVLASEENSLILVGRNEDKLYQMAKELEGHIYPIVYDLNNLTDIDSIFEKNEDIKLDGMVYSAGMDGTWPIKANRTQMMQEMMNVNCFAFVEMARAFYKKKYSNDGSSIVAISSIASLLAETGMSAYAMSKAALNTAVKVMSKEFIRRKIRVNAILPAGVDTPMAREKSKLLAMSADSECTEKAHDLNSLGIITPENIARQVEFLLSNNSRYTTGELLTIGAGLHY